MEMSVMTAKVKESHPPTHLSPEYQIFPDVTLVWFVPFVLHQLRGYRFGFYFLRNEPLRVKTVLNAATPVVQMWLIPFLHAKG